MTRPVSYQVWAPRAERLRLRLDGTDHPMTRGADGWWQPADRLPESAFETGHDYAYLIDDNPTPLPDPRSRWQPEGAHGPSRTFNLADHEWGDHAWTGRQLAGGVIYELHLGTFTPGPAGEGGEVMGISWNGAESERVDADEDAGADAAHPEGDDLADCRKSAGYHLTSPEYSLPHQGDAPAEEGG